jgi:MoaA/NifB/PqqE/SkfB family radical SAM enzyme
MKLSILYRGSLSSCNYACHYCPFAKHQESAAEHARDARALERFVTWAKAQTNLEISVFFTPYGEALVRKRYQEAMVVLSQLEHLQKVVIQTNLSGSLAWLKRTNISKIALWCTYHPTQVSRVKFLKRCAELIDRDVRFSVGGVAMTEQISELEQLRSELPKSVYLWLNAFDRRGKNYYSPQNLERLKAIDPLFKLNIQRYSSRGLKCQAGETVITVDEFGTMRRCHFIDQKIGNIYDADFWRALQPRTCTRGFCDCHIGYVHLNDLGLYDVFENGLLERIPKNWGALEPLGLSEKF